MPSHWTAESTEAYKYAICANFVSAVQKVIDTKNVTMTKIARELGVPKGDAQHLFDRPGNLTLEQMIIISRFLELDLSIVSYNNYPNNERGPVNGQLFFKAWDEKGRAQDFFE